jgi:tRNA nucleotidyltransferase (CCA-adding enzyme)
VGGCVRDLLLGCFPDEWDLEVFNCTEEVLETLFRDQLSFVGKDYGIYRFRRWSIDVGLPRRERPHGPSHGDFSVATDPGMNLVEAARRRDFTINAIYFDPIGKFLEDPFGGQEDLLRRRLRHVSERFGEDPLRVLRGMQFLARFQLKADPQTIQLCRTLSPQFLPPERVFGEFSKLLLRGLAIGDGLEFLNRCGWLAFFPELDSLRSCLQNPQFHPEGTVWEHIKHAMNAFASLRPENDEDALAVGFAVLCHDLGKPACTHIGPDGRLRTGGHDWAGIVPARRFLERIRAPKRLVEGVLSLVENHMVPHTLSDSSPETLGVLRRLARRMGRIDRLLAVVRCDNRGRPPCKPNLEEEDLLERLARSDGIFDKPPEPIIRGRDLLEHFPSFPQKQMGNFLGYLFEAQMDGKFSSLEDGLLLAREVAGAFSPR